MKTKIPLLAAILSPILTLQAIVDTNDNGLSDLWEKQHNDNELFPEIFDPEADPDSDGWTNAQEAAAGTDPFSNAHPNGHLQPETTHIPATWGDIDNDNIPDLITPEVIQVSWPTIAGKLYTLQSNPNLAPDNWIDVDAPFIGTATVVTYNFVTSAAAKTFWRVNITDIDSDGDNLSDAEETQIGSNSQLLDSDGDGLADGVEMANLTNPLNADSDEDGKEDGEDADPNENLVNWEPTIESPYILIDVETSSQESFPRDLNDRGEVLFADGIWSGGNWIPKVLPAGNGNAPSNMPYEINYGPWTHFNASGTLLGRSHLRFLEGPASGGDGVGAPVFLPSNQSSPGLILDTGDVWDPFPLSYRPHGVAADGSMTIRMDPLTVGTSQAIKRFNASGAFVGDITSNGGYEPTGSEGHGEMTASGWVASNLVRTATQTAPAAYRVGLWDASNQEKILPSLAEGWAYPVGVSDLPNEKVVLLAGKWTNDTYSGRVFLPNSVGAYQAVESLSDKKILRFAGDGTALTQDHKLWRNGKLIPFRELCTRYGELLDAEWSFYPLKANKNGVYLIQADGPNGEQKTKLAVPFDLEDNSFATGVDDVSRTADKTDPGWQEDFWIMAPSGKTPAVPPATEGEDCENDTHFFIPLQGDSTHFRITPAECSVTSQNPFPLPAQDNKNPSTWPLVTWHGTAATTTEPDTSGFWSIGKPPTTWQATSLPVKVKVMKRRTVRVAVHKVASVVPGRTNDRPDLMPTEAQLNTYLNQIFEPQINTNFIVSVLPLEPIAFDVVDANSYVVDPPVPGRNSFTFQSLPPTPGNRQLEFISWADKEMSLVTANQSRDYNIHVYIVGGGSPIYEYTSNTDYKLYIKQTAVGITPQGLNYCVIDGDRDKRLVNPDGSPGDYLIPASERSVDGVMHTIAHEIGHVMGLEGHPDDLQKPGVAPLVGTDHVKRLMCSGAKADPS